MKTLCRTLLVVALLGAGAAQAAEITVCIADATIKNNPLYLGAMATTQTRLICEIDKPNYRPTLRDLYQDGWRLISMAGGERALAQAGESVRSPIYYLARDASTGATSEAPRPASPGASPVPESPHKPFSLF